MSPLSADLFAAGGSDVPPPLTVGGLYLYGVSTLTRRGDKWPIGRTVAFVGGGLGTMAVATMSALGTYDDTLISVHMIQHMVLSMVTPVFLCLGAPVTLALRVLPLVWRKRLVALLHSRFAKVVSFPLVAGILFVATPFTLYMSGWYQATLQNDYLHEITHIHFVLVGSLWFWPLLGIDPVPNRLAHPFRLLAIFATLPFHAILGLTIMQDNDLIAASYYNGRHRTWGSSPIADQHAAGGILWGSGDLVGLLVFIVLAVQWAKHSQREAEREDRRLDRLEAEEARRVSSTA
ncbi:MAG: cytochrome C oxidase assembly protein [Catenulispora sp. 13_1_20CM_3_70_7]|nr:MAG: cytochrome C oxidase assembly protein [Catenulispora sp. 13_1_20CM_3_70_7]